MSCKPGSFLVFSNDFVCPRSPQPQKQGWGQNQGGWNRKDDEPELDEEAVTLGWCKLARTLCFTFNCFLILILSSPQCFSLNKELKLINIKTLILVLSYIYFDF